MPSGVKEYYFSADEGVTLAAISDLYLQSKSQTTCEEVFADTSSFNDFVRRCLPARFAQRVPSQNTKGILRTSLSEVHGSLSIDRLAAVSAALLPVTGQGSTISYLRLFLNAGTEDFLAASDNVLDNLARSQLNLWSDPDMTEEKKVAATKELTDFLGGDQKRPDLILAPYRQSKDSSSAIIELQDKIAVLIEKSDLESSAELRNELDTLQSELRQLAQENACFVTDFDTQADLFFDTPAICGKARFLNKKSMMLHQYLTSIKSFHPYVTSLVVRDIMRYGGAGRLIFLKSSGYSRASGGHKATRIAMKDVLAECVKAGGLIRTYRLNSSKQISQATVMPKDSATVMPKKKVTRSSRSEK